MRYAGLLLISITAWLAWWWSAPAQVAADKPAIEQPAEAPQAAAAKQQKPRSVNETHRGRVVFLAEALARRFGVESGPEAKERTLALETTRGELLVLVEDVRGRAFRVDGRLLALDVELLLRRTEGSPAAQILAVYQVAKDGKYELDYWCDICSIAMLEKKDCECCQGETRLRLRKAGE